MTDIHQIFDDFTDGALILDSSGRVLDADPPACAMLGASVAEVCSQSDLLTPDDTSSFAHEAGRLVQGAVVRARWALLTRDGTRLPFEVRVRQLPDQRLEARLRDASAVGQAAASARRTGSLLAAIGQLQSQFIIGADPRETFDKMLAIVLEVTDSEYGFIGEVRVGADGQRYLKTFAITNIAWNDETRAFYREHAPTGMEFFNLKTLFGEVMVTGAPVIANAPATDVRRGGLPAGHPTLSSFLGLPCYHGAQLLGMMGVANRPGGYSADVVQQLDPLVRLCGTLIQSMQAEQQRASAHAALAESDARFRQLAGCIDEVFWLNDAASGEVVYISPAYERIWGRSCADLCANRHAWMDAIHADDRERVVLAEQDIQAGNYDVEYRIVRPEGELRVIRARAFLVRGADGSVTRIAGIAQDVTAQKQLEDRLRHSQKMDAVGQLAGGIAHDFNNLLTVILGNLQVLGGLGLTGEATELVGEIQDSANRAATLTRQLLTFSRRQPVQKIAVRLAEVVDGTLVLLRRLLGETITLETRCAPNLPSVSADVGMLEQVIMNLAINARDAMPNGGHLRILVDTATVTTNGVTCDFVRLCVADTGCGIPLANQAKLFEPFFTTKPLGQGTGLGLATVHGIVQRHDGHITFQSELNVGTTFSVHLPVAAGAASLPVRVKQLATILLVEDEAQVRRLARRVLVTAGYTVLEAEHGPAALKHWQADGDDVELALIDMALPGGMSGSQLAQELRRHRPALNILFVSGYCPEFLDSSFGQDGGDELLQKPYLPNDLLAAVARALKSARVG